MNIHEHQAKQILKQFGVVVPEGVFGFTVEELLEKCKEITPNTPTICGGPLSTLVPDDIIQNECIDIIGRGETEEKLVELVNTYEKNGNKGWNKLYNIPNFWVKDKNYSKNKIIHKNETTLPDISKGLAPDLSIFDPRHFLRPLGGGKVPV